MDGKVIPSAAIRGNRREGSRAGIPSRQVLVAEPAAFRLVVEAIVVRSAGSPALEVSEMEGILIAERVPEIQPLEEPVISPQTPDSLLLQELGLSDVDLLSVNRLILYLRTIDFSSLDVSPEDLLTFYLCGMAL